MQFRVPQNIAMEDKIIGSLTAIQFGILVGGGLLAFFLYTSAGLPKPLNLIIGGGVAFISVTLSLFRFNGQPMFRFFRYMILFLFTPKTRVWKKGGTEPMLIKPSEKKVSTSTNHASKQVSKGDLANLAAVIDSRGQYGAVPPVNQPNPSKK